MFVLNKNLEIIKKKKKNFKFRKIEPPKNIGFKFIHS